MRINFEVKPRHLLISLAIILSCIVSFVSGKILYESRPSYTETVTTTITKTINEPITITGGYAIEPSIGLFMILVGVVGFTIVISKSWN